MCPCSAGVGRTGTFITIDQTLEQVEKERVVNIPQVISNIRRQRMKMVQTVVCGLYCIADNPRTNTHTSEHILLHQAHLPTSSPQIQLLPPSAHTSPSLSPQDQYSFIHDAILESVMCGDTQINTADLRNTLRSLQARNQTEETGFHHQFNVRCLETKCMCMSCDVCDATADTGQSEPQSCRS